jgi:hypothetical protein
MHLFICIPCNILKLVNLNVSLSSVSHSSKLINPEEGVVETPSYKYLVRSTGKTVRYLAEEILSSVLLGFS